eukprot:GILI01003338.1.p1 GENE.GILI01003338.1~~GILI01003338.1.p1  ORF type:complete len:254 (-),score=51.60 GILI01003338.1:316-1077(-)
MMQTVAIQRGPVMAVDLRRNDRYQPGKLLYSAVMDKEAMECFYCWRTCPFCCCKERLAKASYMDVYANGVEVGKPIFNCCGLGCCARDTSIGGFHHYDDALVFGNNAVKGECCSPCPFCFVDQCGCCGEVVVMQGACGCQGSTFFAHHNEFNTCSWCPLIAPCCNISVVFGLAPGEAGRAVMIMNEAASAFKRGNWQKEDNISSTMNPATLVMMAPPMAGSPMAGSPVHQQSMPTYAAAPEQGYSPKAAAGDV